MRGEKPAPDKLPGDSCAAAAEHLTRRRIWAASEAPTEVLLVALHAIQENEMGEPQADAGERRECGCPAWAHGPGAACPDFGEQCADTDGLAAQSIALGVSIGASCAWAGAIASVAATVVNARRDAVRQIPEAAFEIAGDHPVNALHARKMQDYPAIAVETLMSGKVYWDDIIAAAELRDARRGVNPAEPVIAPAELRAPPEHEGQGRLHWVQRAPISIEVDAPSCSPEVWRWTGSAWLGDGILWGDLVAYDSGYRYLGPADWRDDLVPYEAHRKLAQDAKARIAELEAENARLSQSRSAWRAAALDLETKGPRGEGRSGQPPRLSAGWHHLPDVTAPDRSFPARALRFGVP